MPRGIRATVEFSTSDICPIVALSNETEAVVDAVSANVCSADCTESVTEFSIDADLDPDADLTQVFSNGSIHRYRLAHDGEASCPCERLGRFGCPVARYLAHDGRLTLTFYASDYDRLRAAIAELREAFPGMDIKRFVRSPTGESSPNGVFVDMSKLTDRQLEVLETAHEMGYFERPRRANATEIAAALDIDPSTFSEHLAMAETKLLDDVL